MTVRDDLRSALRGWPNGVTVVTLGEAGKDIHGLTVSSFTSVSFDPPMVLVCINRRSTAVEMLEARPIFVVNILSAGQKDIANHFASKPVEGEDRFANIPYEVGSLGAPVLPDTCASLECRVNETIEAGSHAIYLADVEHVAYSRRDPLLYCDRDYRTILYGRRAKPRE